MMNWMTTRIGDRIAAEDGRPLRASRFARLGRLPVPPDAGGCEVRCECDRCGAHLYGAPSPEGRLHGLCFVCGGEAVTPVR
jgi:hypothetical protein